MKGQIILLPSGREVVCCTRAGGSATAVVDPLQARVVVDRAVLLRLLLCEVDNDSRLPEEGGVGPGPWLSYMSWDDVI